jgi:predicted ribosomally synthesized peptide with nif11-like leader
MASQAFIDFCGKAADDADLAKKIEAVQTPADLIALGAASGFVFSEEELKQGAQSAAEQEERELSEGELTAVSGGWFFSALKLGWRIFQLGKKAKWW